MLDDPAVIDMMKKSGESVTFRGPDEYAKIWRDSYSFYANMKEAYSIKGLVNDAPK